jgi:hypothetical protein
MTVISTGMSVYAQKQNQDAQNAAAAHQSAMERARADALREDSKYTLENAKRARQSGINTDTESHRAQLAFIRRMRATQDKVKQDFAARGVFVNAGTAFEEVQAVETLGRQDLTVIRDEFERKAFGFSQQSQDLVHQAQQQNKGVQQLNMNAAFLQGESTRSNPAAIAASLTSGFGTAFGQYSTFKSQGYFGGIE